MFNMLNFVIIGFIIPFIQFVQCFDTINNNQSSSGDKLIFVHALCRHGARNVFSSFPNDISPFRDETYWDGGFAELTNLGKQQQFEFGQYLRNRYANLLGDGRYSWEIIYIQSTDSDRTLMSAQATTCGMFPPSGNQIWNEKIRWQPVPVHTVPMDLDYVLAVRKPCNRLNYIMIEYINSTEYSGIFDEFQTLIDELETYTGLKLPTLHEIFFLQSMFSIEHSMGFNFPARIHDMIVDENSDFNRLVLKAYAFYTATDEMKKFFSGFLLKEILDRFSSKLEATLLPNRTIWMYFAHDLQLQYMLNSLEIDSIQLPEFSSTLLFELYQSDSGPYVQLFYKNSPETDRISLLEIPKCGPKCPLKKLYELYDHFLPKKSHDEECALRDGEVMPSVENTELFEL